MFLSRLGKRNLAGRYSISDGLYSLFVSNGLKEFIAAASVNGDSLFRISQE